MDEDGDVSSINGSTASDIPAPPGSIINRESFLSRERCRGSISLYTAGLLWRIREERQLFWAQWRVIFFCVASLVYFALIVFRNLAYYRFETGPRLHDVGFELIPELTPIQQKHSDMPLNYFYTLIGVVALGVFVGHDCPTTGPNTRINYFSCFSQRVTRNRERSISGSIIVDNVGYSNDRLDGYTHPHEKPYLANIFRRFSSVYLAGHLLRAMTYLPTSLPGSADHCMPDAHLHKPKSLFDCFTRTVSINGNCGDLNFSGHMLLMVMGICMIEQYGARAWSLKHHGTGHIILMSMGVLLCAAQAYLILAARHHYSTDIVLGIIVTPMLWYFFKTEVLPEDMRPNEEQILQEIEIERRWSKGKQVFHAFLTASTVALSLTGLAICVKGNFTFLFHGKTIMPGAYEADVMTSE